MEEKGGRIRTFCSGFLQSMDPEQAAEAAGCPDGFALLESRTVCKRLERMRKAFAGQVRREDAVRRLAQLAFGRVNDAAALAFQRGEADLGTLDLSAVSELKVTDKGGVEIKLITTAENEISLLVSDADVDPACGLLRKTYLH